MADAYVKLFRKMLEWEWYDDNNTKILFIHCLLKANWKSGSWHGIKYEPGQFITSLPSLATETHLTERQVRTALSHLKATGEVSDLRQSNCRIITVNNWKQYQGSDRQSVRPSTDLRQTCDRLATVDKEYKEIKEKEEGKEYKYYPNDEILNAAFVDYVSMRKQIKKPMSEQAVNLAMKKLNELSSGDQDTAVKILEQSIMNSWQGLFPLKADNPSQKIDWSKV